ncbi:diketogulonate reductase-like aldo/keto reductase [Kushneria sinocarnis]|uniref:Diketogulonate reductase-like aldo/keto reductase n=1 Tax=Kushneria sinocarnis TaxID=595502 RepID=A0A420X192_9GAMM|nr:aldo/keto reductase [Kushneria sinocarnis]RKR07544.1 diketogulonate reductase-like aldo/keto reductase [Kushneria sinocarnis]
MTLPQIRLADGTRLPAIGQGSWHMGEGRYTAREEADALRLGLDLGLKVIDTAEMYAGGRSEEVVGEAIRDRRDDAFVVSKVLPGNASRRGTIEACERSLAHLGIEQLDLYLLHWRGGTPLEETLEAFEQLIGDGKIARWGVSNLDTDDMQELLGLSGGRACQTNQLLYNLGSRGIEYDLLPTLTEHDIPVMAYCPVAQGGRQSRHLTDSDAVRAVADRHRVSPTQVLLAWTIREQGGQHPVMAIPKAVRPEHVRDNAAALTLELDDEDLARLDEAFPPPARKQRLDIV